MSSVPDLLHLIIAAACPCTEATGSEGTQSAGEETVTTPTCGLKTDEVIRIYIMKLHTQHRCCPVRA